MARSGWTATGGSLVVCLVWLSQLTLAVNTDNQLDLSTAELYQLARLSGHGEPLDEWLAQVDEQQSEQQPDYKHQALADLLDLADSNGPSRAPTNRLQASIRRGLRSEAQTEVERELYEFLARLAHEQPAADVNTHLDGAPVSEEQLSAPVNLPAEFEAKLGYLTNALNRAMPNSANRSAALDSLLASYLSELAAETDNQLDSSSVADPDEFARTMTSAGLPTTTSSSSSTRSSAASGQSGLAENNASPGPGARYGNAEYIEHPLALAGHQYVQGGAGEGRQLLGPDGMFENVQVVKSDKAVPAYCDPPNPCPVGFTSEDGCLEKFVNSASFSREYQASQECACDNEHSLFNCAQPYSATGDQHTEDSGEQSTDGDTDGAGDNNNNNNNVRFPDTSHKDDDDHDDDDDDADSPRGPKSEDELQREALKSIETLLSGTGLPGRKSQAYPQLAGFQQRAQPAKLFRATA